MGFKADTSFLRFLSMGAIGVQQTMRWLRAAGFNPIELERYCASNKIWMTKVKRLRLPDVLCTRTGLRLEVRAKSDLKIRMSDAPNNPDRTWNAGLRDDDVAAFIAIIEAEYGKQTAADEPVFFTVNALRRSVAKSKLGPPKSASEGAERDRTWPAIIPTRDGAVQSVTAKKIIVEMNAGENLRRKQTYTLNGKHPYVRPDDHFKAEVSILAGTPSRIANMAVFLGQVYDPLSALGEPKAVDRYAGVKALARRDDLRRRAATALERLLATKDEERVALEAAGTAVMLGSAIGQDRIGQFLWGDGRKDLRMEAVLILKELASPFAKSELMRVAADARFEGDELRQAAVWGLGKAGLRAYEELLPFIADPDENVALHAIVAFGSDTNQATIRLLVNELLFADHRTAPAASEALRLIANQEVVRALIEAAGAGRDWVLATLGRLPPPLIRPALEGSGLMKQLGPILLLNEDANWLASQDRATDIAFLTKQNL